MGLMVAIPQIRWTRPLAMLACAALVLSTEARAQALAANAAAAQTATLTADAVFGFGSSALSTAGADSLSSLFNSLGGPQHVVRLTLIGHSDPIETRAHDPQLALARAAAIRAFFVQQGVPSDAIDVSGVADSQSAVGSCTTSSSSSANDCHAGDRRVELHALVRTADSQANTAHAVVSATGQPATPVVASAAVSASALPATKTAETDPPAVPGPAIPKDTGVTSQQISDAAAPKPAISLASAPTSQKPATDASKHHAGSGAKDKDPSTPETAQSSAPAMSYPVETESGSDSTYSLSGGQSLESQVLGWAKRAGWGASWNTPDDWIVPHDMSFGGDFESAITQVFKQLADNGADVRADIWRGNKEVVVDRAGGTQ